MRRTIELLNPAARETNLARPRIITPLHTVNPLNPFSDERSRSFYIVRIVRPFEQRPIIGAVCQHCGRVIRAHQNEGPIEEWEKWSTYSPFSRRTSSTRMLQEG